MTSGAARGALTLVVVAVATTTASAPACVLVGYDPAAGPSGAGDVAPGGNGGASGGTSGSASSSGGTPAVSQDGGPFQGSETLRANLPSDGAGFGFSLALQGSRLVVGAAGDLGVRGAAYVFERDAGSWMEAQKLTAPEPEVDEWFGSAVDIDGDTLVVGAPREVCSLLPVECGAAYVFRRAGGAWTQEVRLAPPTTAIATAFGFAVAAYGDTIAVGAPSAQDIGAGAVYVYKRNGNAWAAPSILYADEAADGDRFGFALAIEGNRLVVGAIEEEVGDGKAYVFERTAIADQFVMTKTLVPPAEAGQAASAQFGHAVALSGESLLVGAPHYTGDGGVTNTGAAFGFVREDADWRPTTLKPQTAATELLYGFSVTLDGAWGAIGALGDDMPAPDNGAAEIVLVH